LKPLLELCLKATILSPNLLALYLEANIPLNLLTLCLEATIPSPNLPKSRLKATILLNLLELCLETLILILTPPLI
jgi:hypothetical protein